MAEEAHETPALQRVPIMDANTLEGRTRPTTPTPMLFGRPLEKQEPAKAPRASNRARGWLRSLARVNVRS